MSLYECLNVAIFVTNLFIIKKLFKMSQVDEQIKNMVGRLNTATNKIAAKISEVLEGEKNNLSDESIAALEAEVAKLEALGASDENPIPEEETEGTQEANS